jgi:hypothetical protein
MVDKLLRERERGNEKKTIAPFRPAEFICSQQDNWQFLFSMTICSIAKDPYSSLAELISYWFKSNTSSGQFMEF